MVNNRTLQFILAAFIIIAAIVTKLLTVSYWEATGASNVYPWFMPYIFIAWGGALCIRLWTEKSRLYSVWVMAIALVWFGFQTFEVAA